ncbi:MAG: histidine kinase [Bacteroidota bacterium]
MRNALLEVKNLYYYLSVWVVIIISHAAVLFFFHDLNVLASVYDALIFNLIFCGLGLSYGYAIKFIGPGYQGIISVVISHVVTIAVVVAVGIFGSNKILESILAQDADYMAFLDQALIWRVPEGALFMAIIVLVYYLFQYSQDLQERITNEARLHHLIKETELEMLKSQINPHFIFNSLNSVSSLTISSPDKAREMVIKLSDFLRYSLGKKASETNALDAELDNMLRYLEIEKVRFGDKLIIETDISSSCDRAEVPNMILQPILENAIKYGVYESTQAVKVELKCHQDENGLKLEVINDYDPEAAPKRGKGLGLKNIRERLRIMYGTDELMKLRRENNQFIVELYVPKEQV